MNIQVYLETWSGWRSIVQILLKEHLDKAQGKRPIVQFIFTSENNIPFFPRLLHNQAQAYGNSHQKADWQ